MTTNGPVEISMSHAPDEEPPLVSAGLGDAPLIVGGAQDQPPMVSATQGDSPLVSTALDGPLKRMKRAGYKPPPAKPIFFPPDQCRLAAREARIGYIADEKEKAQAELALVDFRAQHEQEASRLDMANAKRTQAQAALDEQERKRLFMIQLKQVDEMYEAHDEETVSKVHEIQRQALYTHGRAAVAAALSTSALVHHYVEIINTTGAPKHGEVVAGGREEVREYLFRIFLAEHGTILRISDRFYDEKDFTLVCKDNHCKFAVRMKRITRPEYLDFTSVKSSYAYRMMQYPSSTPFPPAFVIVIPFATHCAHCRVSGEESKWRDSLWLTLDKNDVRRLLVSDRSFTSSNLRSEWFNMLHMVPRDEEALRLGLLNAAVIRGFLPSHGVASHHYRDYRHVPQDLLELVTTQMQRRLEEATVDDEDVVAQSDGDEDVAQPDDDAAQQPAAAQGKQSFDHTSVPLDVEAATMRRTSALMMDEAAPSYQARDEGEEMREKEDIERMKQQLAAEDKQEVASDYGEVESMPMDMDKDEQLIKHAPADMTAQSAHMSIIGDEVNAKRITDLDEVVNPSPDATTVRDGLSVSNEVLTKESRSVQTGKEEADEMVVLRLEDIAIPAAGATVATATTDAVQMPSILSDAVSPIDADLITSANGITPQTGLWDKQIESPATTTLKAKKIKRTRRQKQQQSLKLQHVLIPAHDGSDSEHSRNSLVSFEDGLTSDGVGFGDGVLGKKGTTTGAVDVEESMITGTTDLIDLSHPRDRRVFVDMTQRADLDEDIAANMIRGIFHGKLVVARTLNPAGRQSSCDSLEQRKVGSGSRTKRGNPFGPKRSRIGNGHQAIIPACEYKKEGLVWDPSVCSEGTVVSLLQRLRADHADAHRPCSGDICVLTYSHEDRVSRSMSMLAQRALVTIISNLVDGETMAKVFDGDDELTVRTSQLLPLCSLPEDLLLDHLTATNGSGRGHSLPAFDCDPLQRSYCSSSNGEGEVERWTATELRMFCTAIKRFDNDVRKVWKQHFSEYRSLPQVVDFYYRTYCPFLYKGDVSKMLKVFERADLLRNCS